MRRHTGSFENSAGESAYRRPPAVEGKAASAYRVDADQLHVRDLMSRDLVVLPAWLAVSALADRITRPRHGVYPVIDATGAPIGVIDLAEIDGEPSTDDRLLAEVCTPVSQLPVVRPDDIVATPLPRLLTRRNTLVLVTESDRLVGIVSSGALLRFARGRAMAALTASSPSESPSDEHALAS